MSLPLRPALALLAVAALSFATAGSRGFYTRAGWLLTVYALAAALLACLGGEWRWRAPRRLGGLAIVVAAFLLAVQCGSEGDQHRRLAAFLGLVAFAAAATAHLIPLPARALPNALLFATALLLGGHGLLRTGLLYAEEEGPRRVVLLAACAGLALTASFLPGLRAVRSLPRWFWLRVALIFLAGAALRTASVRSSPAPIHDLYDWLRDASGHLLHGENPYSAVYKTPYTTPRAARYGFRNMTPNPHPPVYPPLPIVLALPFRAIDLDVRYANALCDLLAGGVLLLLGTTRGRPLTGALALALYLNLPGAPLLIEQAYYEPMLAAALGAGLLLAERGWRLGYLLVGVGVTGKQFGLPLLLPLARALRRRWLLALVLAGLGLAILPFFLWDPTAFLEVVVLKHLRRPQEFASLTLLSGSHDLAGLALPRCVMWGLAAVLAGAVAWRTPERGVGSSLWAGAALLAFCFCHTQGFFHYYYLCQYLLLLGAVGLLSDRPSREQASGAA